jgi:hypothetical protein
MFRKKKILPRNVKRMFYVLVRSNSTEAIDGTRIIVRLSVYLVTNYHKF